MGYHLSVCGSPPFVHDVQRIELKVVTFVELGTDIHSQVNSYSQHPIAQPPQRPPELFFRVRHYHQMLVARAQAELLHPLAGRDLFGDCGVGAFDEQRRAFVRASPRGARL